MRRLYEGLDVTDPQPLKHPRSALPVTALKASLMKVAGCGRVLVLLDACYSGGTSLDRRAQPVASSILSIKLAAANISVLTSSSA
jgi:hypothetical protein